MQHHEAANGTMTVLSEEPVASYVPPVSFGAGPKPETVWNWVTDPEQIWPTAPTSAGETGIPAAFLEDLLAKHLHYSGPSSVERLCSRTGLSFEIVDELLQQMKTDKHVEVTSASHYGELSYQYRLTERGEQRAEDVLTKSGYASVAPVVLEDYVAVVQKQSLRQTPPSPGRILEALSPFVMSPEVMDALARALHSGRATLIFGASGNGKTAIIESYARHADDTVIIPYALYVHGQIVRIFDAAMHTKADADTDPLHDGGLLKASARASRFDQRWVRVRRPVVVVGGELTQESLELSYDPVARFYQAPPHVKAQDGVFVIDDFGRQRVRPEELLNRWILPMERGFDLLTLHSGESFTIPFEIALMFSTNLSPADLVDEAFLRRIPYKVNLPSPKPDQFKEIMRRICTARRVSYSEETLSYLMRRLYAPDFPFEPRGAYPRDLVQIIADSSRFDGIQPVLSPEMIERAIQVYFIEE
jgi:predicted ATPase with chaperone activity